MSKKKNLTSLDRELRDLEERTSSPVPNMKLEPGKVYRGSFWISEKGQITVKPSEMGTNPTGSERVGEGDGFILYRTKNTIRAVISIPRSVHEDVKNGFKTAMLASYDELLRLKLE